MKLKNEIAFWLSDRVNQDSIYSRILFKRCVETIESMENANYTVLMKQYRDKIASLSIQLDQMRENVGIAYDVGEGRQWKFIHHLTEALVHMSELNENRDNETQELTAQLLVVKAELITERALSDKIRKDEKEALRQVAFMDKHCQKLARDISVLEKDNETLKTMCKSCPLASRP